jgi:peptidyl-prolyl cis-trans isomerase A (cyclophilin A)
MRALLVLGTVACLSGAAAVSADPPAADVVIETDQGTIRVRLDPAHAPRTAANFLRYVDEHFFDDTSFYRTVRADNQPTSPVKIAVIQGGPDERKPAHEPIPLERTSVTGLRHLDGTLSMARDGPDTATAEFFICVGDQPALDFGGERNPDGQGFAAFGQVVKGMDVVRRINQAPVNGQRLTPPVVIRRIVRAN